MAVEGHVVQVVIDTDRRMADEVHEFGVVGRAEGVFEAQRNARVGSAAAPLVRNIDDEWAIRIFPRHVRRFVLEKRQPRGAACEQLRRANRKADVLGGPGWTIDAATAGQTRPRVWECALPSDPPRACSGARCPSRADSGLPDVTCNSTPVMPAHAPQRS